MDDFTEFYLARKDAVLRAVGVASNGWGSAEDAVAEAFTRAYARWPSVAAHPNPTAWVVRTALNVQRSWWRRLRRESAHVLSSRPAPDQAPAAASGVGLDAELRNLVEGLPRRQREVLALRLLVDLSTHETARLLGVTPSTVDVHLHRALASLRDRLSERPDSVEGRL